MTLTRPQEPVVDKFDPHYTWLGIPPEHRPVNHYRLLAIEPFESNPDVIANAADQRMGLVRTFQSGKHAAQSQQLLNELAAARLCLLNPAAKADYDAKLHERLSSALPSFEAGSARPARRKARRSPWWMPTLAGGAGAIVLVVGLVQGGYWPPGSPRTAAIEPQQETSFRPAPKLVGGTNGFAPAAPEKNAPAETTRPSETTGKEADSSDALDFSQPAIGTIAGDTLDAIQAEAREEDQPTGRLADLFSDVLASVGEEQQESEPNEDGSPTNDAKSARSSVPATEAQQAALKLVQELYGPDIRAAATRAQRGALAERLIRDAAETKDPTSRYVLLGQARELAVAAGDGRLIATAVAALNRHYEVDALRLTAADFFAASKQNFERDVHVALLDQVLDLVETAVEHDRFDIAIPLETVALNHARKAKGRELFQRIEAQVQAAKELQGHYQKAAAAAERLKQQPEDAEANLTYGRYLCLVKGDWERGLPLLKRGRQPKLREVASQDLAAPNDPAGQVRLADAWYELIDEQDEVHQPGVQERAAHWYRLALGGAAGLDRVKCEKRLQEISQQNAIGHAGGNPNLLAEDLHQGVAGHKVRDNVFTLKAARPVSLERTQLRYRAYGDAGNDSNGDIFLSLDGNQWIKIGAWSAAKVEQSKANDYWHTLSFSSIGQPVRTSRILVRFDYRSGRNALVITAAQWLPE